MKRVAIITNIPAPYRVDFFDYLQKNYSEYEFTIVYTDAAFYMRKILCFLFCKHNDSPFLTLFVVYILSYVSKKHNMFERIFLKNLKKILRFCEIT